MGKEEEGGRLAQRRSRDVVCPCRAQPVEHRARQHVPSESVRAGLHVAAMLHGKEGAGEIGQVQLREFYVVFKVWLKHR